jgi:hypothetical protein
MRHQIRRAGIVLCAALWVGSVNAQSCAEEVIRNLFGELEAIDTAGEGRLKTALDQLAAQESWSEAERGEFTAAIADNPDVDAAETTRGEMIAQLFGLVQRGEVDCVEIRDLHGQVLALEEAQWDNAVKRVQQRIFH